MTEGVMFESFTRLTTVPNNSTFGIDGTTFRDDIMGNYSEYPALRGFEGQLDLDYVKLINPFWLKFDPPGKNAHYTMGVLYIIQMIVGCSGNAFVIFMFMRFKSLRTPANTLVLNLAVSDFFMTAKVPIAVYNCFKCGPALNGIWCKLYGFGGGITGTASITTLTAISIDRYYVVVYPLDPLKTTTTRRSRLMVLFVWCYSLTFAIIPALDIGLSQYIPEGYLTTCSFDYLSKSRDSRIFMYCYFVAAWCVPFVAIAYCYFYILRVVISANSIQSSKDKNKTEFKLAMVVIGVIGLWFVAWTPYAIVALLGISGNENAISPLGSMLPAFFCKSAAAIDPYVYAVTHPRFRVELQKMFCKKAMDRAPTYQSSTYTRAASSKRRVAPDNKDVARTIRTDEEMSTFNSVASPHQDIDRANEKVTAFD